MPHASRFSVFCAVVRRSGPHIIEASLIPTALFYCCLVVSGLTVAYASALAWVYGALAYRALRKHPVPPLLVLGAAGITLRTTVAMASGSAFVYFAQPVLAQVGMGFVFLASIVLGKPLVEHLALEFWPLTQEMRDHPAVSRLLRNLTFLWAALNLTIGAITLAMLWSLPLATYVALKPVASWTVTGIGVALTIHYSIRTARRAGFMAQRAEPALAVL
jgi:hypothetical protein